VAGVGPGTAAVTLVSGLNRPYGVAAGEGSIWVTEYERGNLVRIDPATNRVVGRVHVGDHASQLLVQGGFVWVLDDLGKAVIRVDAVNNRQVNRIPIVTDFFSRPLAFAGGAGSVWVTVGTNSYSTHAPSVLGELVQIDTATSAVTKTTIDGIAAGVTVGDGALWVSTILQEPTSIFRIDPATKKVVARVETGHVGGGPVAFTDSGLWVANVDGYLTHIDSRTNKVVGSFEVGSPEWPAMLAVGKDLWLSAPLDNLVARIDPTTGAVSKTIPAGRRPQGFAFLGNDLWVANYVDGTVMKLPIN
jgi:streptogramin lyase